METTRQLFDVAANTTLERRSGDITIRSGELSETVTIYQSGEEPALVLTQNEYDVEAAGETIKVEINSNIAYTVEIAPEADWIAEQQTRSLSTHTRYFTVAPNGSKARSAELVFRSADYGLEERVVVRQKEAEATTVHVPLGQSLMVVMEEMGLNPAEIVRLKISGYLTQADFQFIKENMVLALLDLYEVDLPLLPDMGHNRLFGKVAELVFPHNLREIPSYVVSNSVYYNDTLTSVTIPASVETIKEAAFKECISLTSVEIPAGVETIGINAFEDCCNLRTVTFEKGSKLKVLPGDCHYNYKAVGVFKGCEALVSIEIPASVETIETGAFANCTALKTVTFEKGSQLKRIVGDSYGVYKEYPHGAFEYCSALTSIEIPASVTEIGTNAFYGCSALYTITFEQGAQIDRINRFGASGLRTIEIPASVQTISKDAFNGCSSLTVFTFEKGSQLKTIEGCAFNNTTLHSVEIPANVQTIEDGAFAHCLNLKTVTFEKGLQQLKELGKEHYHNGYTCQAGVFEGCTSLTSVEIPASVETIQRAAFKGCTSLTSVTIPASVKTIGERAFAETSLTSVEIPASVEAIEGAAFLNCTSLASVTFEENSQLKQVRNEAFENCALTAVKIPASVERISEDAFSGNSLDKLTFEEGSQLTYIGIGAFPLSSNCVELDLSPCTQLNTIGTWTLPASVQTVRLGMLTPPVNAEPIPDYSKNRIFFTENYPKCMLMIPWEANRNDRWQYLGFNKNNIYYY